MRLSPVLRSKLGASLNTSQPLTERFVPTHRPVPSEYVSRIDDFLADKRRLLVLTGAGISTESGIPDYRSAGVGMYARSKDHRPVQHIEFVRSAAIRQRYWARNFVAWPRFSAFQPNATHAALARFEHDGRLSGLITQNVDRLHLKAGSRNVLELHGHTHSVVCVGRIDCAGRRVTACDYRVERAEFQLELERLNGTAMTATDSALASEALRPDGDVAVPPEFMASFEVPVCPRCGGDLKPDVVFFGDSVPKARHERIEELLAESDALLVLGSSLHILSGYRIVVGGHERGLPVVIVNIGETRADAVATMKLAAKCGDVVPRLFGGGGCAEEV